MRMDLRIAAHVLLDHVQDAIVVLDERLQVVYSNAAARLGLPSLPTGAGLDRAPPSTSDAFAFVHPDDVPIAATAMAEVARLGSSVTFQLRVPRDDRWVPVEVTAGNYRHTLGIDGYVLCFRDLTTELALRAALDQQVTLRTELADKSQTLTELLRLHQLISRHERIDTVFAAVVDAACNALHCPVGVLRLIDPTDANQLHLVASRGLPDHIRSQGLSIPIGQGMSGRAVSTGQVAEGSPPPEPGLYLHLDGQADLALAAPIRSEDTIVGALTVGRTAEQPFSDGDRRNIVVFADHVGAALRDARTESALREAYTDHLTGLPSRRLFRDRMRQSMARSRRSDIPLSVLFIDLDDFKTINDDRGHSVGDAVLRECVRRIHNCVRTNDTAARWGGDEFVMLLENADAALAAAIGKRIIHAVAEPIGGLVPPVSLGATVGSVTWSPSTDTGDSEPDDLVRRADVAMYHGKLRGGSIALAYQVGMAHPVRSAVDVTGQIPSITRRDGRISAE
jgi:diguanylate cyclase (GGDEF)-like protein